MLFDGSGDPHRIGKAVTSVGDSGGDVLRRSWQESLLDLPRYTKRTLLVLADLLIASAVLWVALSLRYGHFYVPNRPGEGLLAAAGPLITIGTLAYANVYRVVTRHLGLRNAGKVFGLVLLSVLIWSFLVFMVGQLGVPRSTLLIYGLGAASCITLYRAAVGLLLENSGLQVFRQSYAERRPVLIYGAGRMGVELMHALQRSSDCRPIGFMDQSKTLWGQYIKGLKVYRPARLQELIDHQGVSEVILALPEGERRERRAILRELERFPVQVKILPAFEDVASGRVRVADVRPVDVIDLLGRDAVPPVADLLARNTRNKSVLVTGAGGSIGSELVRQILKHGPRHIVLLDISEPALYAIDREVERLIAAQYPDGGHPTVRAVLGNVLDERLVAEAIARNAVDTIYHAAAYKHVPIVENNPIVGLLNNAFGAVAVADAAKAAGVERVVLISTDKAVRPTNVMGASKRLAELVLQAAASERTGTVFTMVRFGNVLDSSGSVVPVFRSQIKAGGPVTVTHADVERYFMSIPEAAELVLQAGAMAEGGEVFLLHMGDPVKIIDLARLMVHLSGLTVREPGRPDGDIEIVITGLRPGEKLYEELLIGAANASVTEHPRIFKSDEPFLKPHDLNQELDALKSLMTRRDYGGIDEMLERLVEGYRPQLARDQDQSMIAPWPPHSGTLH